MDSEYVDKATKLHSIFKLRGTTSEYLGTARLSSIREEMKSNFWKSRPFLIRITIQIYEIWLVLSFSPFGLNIFSPEKPQNFLACGAPSACPRAAGARIMIYINTFSKLGALSRMVSGTKFKTCRGSGVRAHAASARTFKPPSGVRRSWVVANVHRGVESTTCRR